MILYRENPKDTTKELELLKQMNSAKVTVYGIINNIQRSVAFP